MRISPPKKRVQHINYLQRVYGATVVGTYGAEECRYSRRAEVYV
jgi:hypothetical protein